MIGEIFNTLLSRPLFNLLVAFYAYVTPESLGFAVILLTVLVRLALWPLFHKMARSQAAMQKIQPEMQRIQKEYKNDRVKQTELMMELYKKHNVNPFGSFGLIFIQLPVVIALYRVFLKGFSVETAAQLYSFMPRITSVDPTFLGVIDLSVPSIPIALVAALLQYVHAKMSIVRTGGEGDQNNPAARMGRNMAYIAPAITLVVLWKLPAVVGLYWATTTVIGVIQQRVINKHIHGR